MGMYVGASGAWKRVEGFSVGASGTWKTVLGGWVGVSGVWKRFYELLQVSVTNQNLPYIEVGASAFSVYRLNSSGAAQHVTGQVYPTGSTTNISGEWLVNGTASNVEARVTVNSGTLTGGTTGSWLGLGTTRDWYVEQIATGTKTCNFTVELRDAETLDVLDSASITVEAQNSL